MYFRNEKPMIANYAYFTPADYFALERASPMRHEYRPPPSNDCMLVWS
ncbi:hypothetical protein [Leptothoe sp. PORK10 BA2]|nr:hypothetical protein [Leptothoe sp. PORK10 BA2]MEA5465342.1 hypothetical protein [Leptothoe sp. PORK10 BA2]